MKDLSYGFSSVMVLQTCMVSLRSDPISSSETCLRSSVDGNEDISIKVEEATDVKEEEHPGTNKFPTIKTEPEVSFVPG